MGETLTHKLIRSHLADGAMNPGDEIALGMDQALLQDATGTLAWLEFEQMGQGAVAIRQATQYVDHNILQTGYENADDHRFLRSVCERYGAIFSGPGNGISHWAHMERFHIPGETMLGCDSHTPHAGACGMLAIGAGGFEVANAMAGEPYRLTMPEVVRIKLTGKFKPWVSAKDVILELLNRFDVKWAKNKVLEYAGPALKELTVPSRGTIANMGTELGATASLFPADGLTKQFLTAQARGKDFKSLGADDDAHYDDTVDIDLGTLEPLIACPSSPDNVKPVSEVGDRSRSGSGREQRELVLPGSQRRRARAGWEARRSRHCDGGLPGFPADPPPHADERPHDEADQGRRPRTRGGMRTLHRHGFRTANERAFGPHVQPKLRGTEWDRGRPRLPVQPRDRGGDGGPRSHHRSAGT